MLVLTRKAEEKIVIGKGPNQIVITILRIQGDKVSVGIEADKETPIYRDELLAKGQKKTTKKELASRKNGTAQNYANDLSSAEAEVSCDANKDAWV
ncbi:MAG: carbon storage regulator [Parachlamydia sp.]|nr:carbon storage regulator [Parachlamydia sp.]